MKHIKTTCQEESKARKDFSSIEPGNPVVASDDIENTVKELLYLMSKIDEDTLKASRMKAIIMNAMGHRDTLKSKDGKILVSWKAGSIKCVVDYKGLLEKYKVNVSKDDLNKFTTKNIGSRVFNIETD